MTYIFIDESGDLGLTGSKYLVLAALIVTDFSPLNRIVKNLQRNKFKKELKKASEIKANNSSREFKKTMLSKLNEVNDARVFYVVLEKKKIFSHYLKSNHDKLYNFVAGKLAQNIPIQGGKIEIRIDKSKGKQVLQQDFNGYFLKKLKNNDAQITIFHSYSHAWTGLQFADLLAWSCFQKFEHQLPDYIDLLKLEQEVYLVW